MERSIAVAPVTFLFLLLMFLKSTWYILEPSLFPKHALMWCPIPKVKLVLDIPWFQMGKKVLGNPQKFIFK